jgi:hypothetical protein
MGEDIQAWAFSDTPRVIDLRRRVRAAMEQPPMLCPPRFDEGREDAHPRIYCYPVGLRTPTKGGSCDGALCHEWDIHPDKSALPDLSGARDDVKGAS